MRYFPECNYKNALRHFRDEIVKTRGLLEALTEIGYTSSQRTLTLRQMKVIEEFLGEPNGHKSHELLHTHYTDRSK